jgi:hypothetical protein
MSPAFLFALPVMLSLLFLAVNHLHLTYSRAATQRVTDASALAGAQALVVDAHLTADASDLADLETLAFAQAQNFADINPLSPAPLVYDIGEPDPNDNDIRFTTIDNPLDPTGALQLIDSVEVIGKRTGASGVPIFGAPLFSLHSANIVTRSKAVLDRHVIGFRPLFNRSIPLAPIALLATDWASQVQVSVGPPNTISSYTVNLGDPAAPKSSFLHLGQTALTALSVQLESGITPSDLTAFGGEFVLPPGGTLDVPGDFTATEEAGLKDIRAQLEALKASGAARAWPLYSAPMSSSGNPVVVDFVAARVADVGVVKTSGGNSTLSVTLAPAFLSSPTVVTDAAQPINPYLCRIRLAQ